MESMVRSSPKLGAKQAEGLLGLLARGRVFGLVSLISVCTFWQRPLLLTAILIMVSCVVLVGRKNRQELIIFLACGALGATAEIFVVAFGAWSYSKPQILGIPYWLPVAWGLSALFIRKVTLRVAVETAEL